MNIAINQNFFNKIKEGSIKLLEQHPEFESYLSNRKLLINTLSTALNLNYIETSTLLSKIDTLSNSLDIYDHITNIRPNSIFILDTKIHSITFNHVFYKLLRNVVLDIENIDIYNNKIQLIEQEIIQKQQQLYFNVIKDIFDTPNFSNTIKKNSKIYIDFLNTISRVKDNSNKELTSFFFLVNKIYTALPEKKHTLLNQLNQKLSYYSSISKSFQTNLSNLIIKIIDKEEDIDKYLVIKKILNPEKTIIFDDNIIIETNIKLNNFNNLKYTNIKKHFEFYYTNHKPLLLSLFNAKNIIFNYDAKTNIVSISTIFENTTHVEAYKKIISEFFNIGAEMSIYTFISNQNILDSVNNIKVKSNTKHKI